MKTAIFYWLFALSQVVILAFLHSRAPWANAFIAAQFGFCAGLHFQRWCHARR